MNQSDKRNLYQATLVGAGYRITEQRRLLCEHLAAIQTHPTAYEIFASLAQAHPEISRATVYNTLNKLKELGAIVELSFAGDHSRYETDPNLHINLICLRCHRIVDYEQQSQTGANISEEIIAEVAANSDFQPISGRVELLGFCIDCRNQRKSELRQQIFEQHAKEDA